jgi:hypothetical protein
MPSHRIWEWEVDRGANSSPVGISGTRHRAMAALSQTLIAVGGPASGHVVPIVLVDGACEVSYLRLGPPLTADHDSGVIRWH